MNPPTPNPSALETELLLLADGSVLAGNLTREMAVLLSRLRLHDGCTGNRLGAGPLISVEPASKPTSIEGRP